MRGYGNPGTQFGTPVDPNGRAIGLEAFHPEQTALADVNFDGKSIRDLGGLAIGYKTIKEVWIGKRTAILGSRPAGSGSKDDPFDGTTKTQVDALIAAALAREGGSVICFRDGAFEFSPFQLLAGCELYGAGRDNTVFVLSPSVGSTIVNFLHAIRSSAAVRVEGFTLDLNYLALDDPPAECAINGITLFGDGCVIRNVRVKNGYGNFDSLHEHFGIIIQNTATDSSVNWLIEYCEVSGMHGNYGGAISSLCHYPDVVGIGGAVSKCLVKDYSKAATGVAGALHGIGVDSGSIENCTILNTDHAIYTELGRGVKIYSNTIRDAYIYGIILNAVQDMPDCSIMYNDVEMRDDYAIARCAIAFGTDGTHFVKNAQVDHNTLRMKETGSPNASDFQSAALQGLYLDDAHSLGWGNSFTHNKIDAAYLAAGITIPSDSYRIGNRRRLTGDTILTILDTTTTKARFSAHGSGNQTIPSDVNTKLIFSAEDQDPDNVLTDSVFTAPRPGDYTFRVYTEPLFDNLSGYTRLLVKKNASFVQPLDTQTGLPARNGLKGAVRLTLALNDTIAIYVFQNSGSPGDIQLDWTGGFQGNES